MRAVRLLYAKQPEQDTRGSFVATDPITGNTQWSVKYEYDNNSNLTKVTDARGVYVEGEYDNLDRITYRNYSDSTPDVSFYYDGKYLDSADQLQTATGSAKGKTTGIKSSASRTNYTTFDNLGRLLTHQQITEGQTYSTSYTYNLSGGIVTETYPSGRVVGYDLNADGELSRVWSQKGGNTATLANSFGYSASGALQQMRLGNGKWEAATYNNRHQITQIALGSSIADTSLLKLNYDYGNSTQNNGSLREQKINYSGLPSEIKQTLLYDDLNRLKSSTETHNGGTQTSKETFNYDRFGNRTFDAANTTTLSQSLSWKVTNPTIEASNNRLKEDQDSDSVLDYDFDPAGNVILDAENKRFVYDAENRQTQFFAGQNQTQTPDATYYYDGEGRRVKKVSDTETTVFVYNAAGTLVGEYSSASSPAPKTSYLTADHLGSPRVVTSEYGAVVARHDYTGFGRDIVESLGNIGGRSIAQGHGVDDKVRKQYTGYERDDESGLEYAQARYYNSGHGRFTSPDPLTASASIRDPQTLNRYNYVLNSPYKFTDPLGLLHVSTNACGACADRRPQPEGSGGGGVSGGMFSPEIMFADAGVAAQDSATETSTDRESVAASVHEAVHVQQQQTQTPPPAPPPPIDSSLAGSPEFQEYVANLPKPVSATVTLVEVGPQSVPLTQTGPYKVGSMALLLVEVRGDDGKPFDGYISESVVTYENGAATGTTENKAAVQLIDGKFYDIVSARGVQTLASQPTDAQVANISAPMENTPTNIRQIATFTITGANNPATLTVVHTRVLSNRDGAGNLRAPTPSGTTFRYTQLSLTP